MSVPIYQCQRGHVLCSICEESLQKCPVCEIALLKTAAGKIRSLTVEELQSSYKGTRRGKQGRESTFREQGLTDVHSGQWKNRLVSLCKLLGEPWVNCGSDLQDFENMDTTRLADHLRKVHKMEVEVFAKKRVTIKAEVEWAPVDRQVVHLYNHQHGIIVVELKYIAGSINYLRVRPYIVAEEEAASELRAKLALCELEVCSGEDSEINNNDLDSIELTASGIVQSVYDENNDYGNASVKLSTEIEELRASSKPRSFQYILKFCK